MTNALTIGWHRATGDALGFVAVPQTGSGLMLGRDSYGRPGVVHMFRPEPARVVVIDETWLGRLVAFRALALGCRMAISSQWPDHWRSLGRIATGRDDRAIVVPADRPHAIDANIATPALYLYDVGPAGAPAGSVLGPWCTELNVLPRPDPVSVGVLERADVVITQRLSPREASALCAALRRPNEVIGRISGMPDDLVAVMEHGTERYFKLIVTPIEERLLG